MVANTESNLYQEFEALLSKYDYKFSKGDLIKGIVVGFDSVGVLVDIGAKTAAIVPNREMSAIYGKKADEVVEIGEEKEFLILKEENEDGQFTLSLKKVETAYSWQKLDEIKQKDETIESEVISVVKGGILVDVMGLRGFVPSSHLRSSDISTLVGEKLELKILSLDQQQNNLILSHRKVVSDIQAGQRKTLFDKIDIGSVVEGEVVRLAEFGAFIDIGGLDGLLPLSQMSWRWVDHPADILKVGDKIKVEIIGVDQEKQRVSLSLKNLQPDPWVEAQDYVKEGEYREGKVTRIKHFGAFVEVYPGVEALLPYKEMIEYQNSTGEVIEVDKVLKTKIIKFNPEDRRISLSLSDVAEEPKPAKEKPAKKEKEEKSEE